MILVAVLLMIGCTGSNFKYDSARKVEVGMTEDQITQLMGKPYSVVSKGETQIWIWSYVNAFTANSQSVSFIMKDGKVYNIPNIPASFD